jgi:hypothetical protein
VSTLEGWAALVKVRAKVAVLTRRRNRTVLSGVLQGSTEVAKLFLPDDLEGDIVIPVTPIHSELCWWEDFGIGRLKEKVDFSIQESASLTVSQLISNNRAIPVESDTEMVNAVVTDEKVGNLALNKRFVADVLQRHTLDSGGLDLDAVGGEPSGVGLTADLDDVRPLVREDC